MEKILLNSNRDKILDFETSLELVAEGSNNLITIFESFQPWTRITTLQEFISLVTDPIKLMDLTLQANSGVNIESTGGRLPAPEMVAKLLDIDRENYIAIISGKKVSEGCKSCGKLKVIKKGEGVLNFRTFHNYQEWLLFNQGRFSINENAVEKKKESFKIYIESEKQINVYNHWHNLCDILNDHAKRGYIGDLDSLAKMFHGRLTFSYQANKLSLDEQSLINELSQLNKK